MTRLIAALGSRAALWVICALFAASALVIALTAPIGLTYDELYHFQIIDFFAHRWSPFVTHQPASMAPAGDLTRYGSYLYHYLMGFPQRLLLWGGASTRTQFDVLRMISIAMSTAALPWFRRMLRDAGASGAVANAAVFIYCALPITSFIAATINYDNLLMLCAAIHLSLGVRIWRDASRSFAFYCVFVGIGALACLVVYEYLPMFAAATIAVAVRVAFLRRRGRVSMQGPVGRRAGCGIARTVGAIAFAVVGLGLFIERYGVNIVLFHSLEPDCARVQTTASCSRYAPWARNQAFLHASSGPEPITIDNVARYAWNWIDAMLRSATAVGVGGVTSPGAPVTLLLIAIAAVVAALIVVASLPVLLRRPGFQFLAAASTGYLMVLFLFNYGQFRQMHQLVAVQGRYAMPVIIPFLGAAGLGLAAFVRSRLRRAAPMVLVGIAAMIVLLSTQGGFLLNYFAVAGSQWRDPTAPLSALFQPLSRLARAIVLRA